MKITRIEIQKNDNTRFNLYSEDKFIMGISYENLIPYGFSEFEISDEELLKLYEKENEDSALRSALRYSSRAMKSEKEVRDYLYKKNISEEIEDKIIEKLKDLNLLDDERYLSLYLEDKFLYGDDGSAKIKSKLIQKGLDSQKINLEMENFEEQERKNLKNLISKKINSYLEKKDGRNKMIRFLMNKGYSYSLIKEELDFDIFDEK